MRNPTHPSFHRSLVIFVVFILALSNFAHALHSPKSKTFKTSILRRQSDAPFNNGLAETVQTEQTVSTAEGLVTLSCTITLTPIVVNGQNLVQEDKSCDTNPVFGNPNTQTVNVNTVTSVNTATIVNSEQTFATTPALQTPPPQVFSTTTIGIFTPVFPPSVATTAPTPAATTPATIFTPATPPTVTQASTTPDGTAAAANASQSTGFTLPGQKLQVLPIGLGVFAGISVIALIVVGLVTYERTKYRKAFRARKLAEQAANMGYGGMSTRV